MLRRDELNAVNDHAVITDWAEVGNVVHHFFPQLRLFEENQNQPRTLH